MDGDGLPCCRQRHLQLHWVLRAPHSLPWGDQGREYDEKTPLGWDEAEESSPLTIRQNRPATGGESQRIRHTEPQNGWG